MLDWNKHQASMSFYELHQKTVPFRKAVAEWQKVPVGETGSTPAVVGHYENPLRVEVRSCSL
jgi:hypothetical protein